MAVGGHPALARPQAARTPVRTRRRPSWLDSYLVASVAVTGWAVAVALTGAWGGDFRLHVATVRTLAGDLASPPDPMVGVGEGSPYYSPYMLLAAVVTRLTGAAPATVLAVFAVLNTVLLLVAFRRFVRCVSPSAAAATLALAALLLLWGFDSPVWSGFPDLASLANSLPYPSTVAFALMLLLWERLWRLRDQRSAWRLVVIGALAAAIVLIHPFTAVGTAIGAVALAVGARLPASTWGGLLATAVAAAAAAAGWPYSSVTDLFAAAPALQAVHRPLRTALLEPDSLMCLYGVVGLPVLAVRLRRDRLDPLVLMFAVAGVTVLVALVTGQHHLLRVVPVMMLPLQVAFGVFVTDRAGAVDMVRYGTAAVAVALFLTGLTVSDAPLRGAASAVPVDWLPESVARRLPAAPPGAEAERVRDHAPPGATVLTDLQAADRHLNLIGYYSVNPGWPNPWIGDEDVRAADRDRFLDAGTGSAERGAIARRYGVACVLLLQTPAVTGADAVDGYRLVDTWDPHGVLYCR